MLREPAKASVASLPAMGLCGHPLCSAEDLELSTVHVPKLSYCNKTAQDLFATEFSLFPEDSTCYNNACLLNLQTAKHVVHDIFAELETQCIEERCRYVEAGIVAPRHKCNIWATYTDKARLQRFVAESLEFVRQNADCRTRRLTIPQLRFLMLLQHSVEEDTSDFYKPEMLRKHQDVFEGILTDGVNSNLVMDAHRSEFSLDGQSFSFQDMPQHDDCTGDDMKHAISRFQTEFIVALESYVLAFCRRKELSSLGTRRLLQAVTTQMSQAGLANFDQGSQAMGYFVGSDGLDQRTVYNLSTMPSANFGESLKLTILCMKTGFSQYFEKDDLLSIAGGDSPKQCSPTSYLYKYATLRFSLGPNERTFCTVLDALDEVYIDPAEHGSIDEDPRAL